MADTYIGTMLINPFIPIATAAFGMNPKKCAKYFFLYACSAFVYAAHEQNKHT